MGTGALTHARIWSNRLSTELFQQQKNTSGSKVTSNTISICWDHSMRVSINGGYPHLDGL